MLRVFLSVENRDSTKRSSFLDANLGVMDSSCGLEIFMPQFFTHGEPGKIENLNLIWDTKPKSPNPHFRSLPASQTRPEKFWKWIASSMLSTKNTDFYFLTPKEKAQGIGSCCEISLLVQGCLFSSSFPCPTYHALFFWFGLWSTWPVILYNNICTWLFSLPLWSPVPRK